MKLLLFTLLLMTGVIVSVTEYNEDPHLFNYVLYLKSSYQPCMGTLIAPQWVITAAHCFLPDLQVIFTGGARNFNFHNLIGEILPYEKIIVHPNFTVTSPKNDLMLIKLSAPLTFFSNSIFQLPTINIKKNESIVCFIYIWLKDEESSGNPVGNLYSIKIQTNTDSRCKILLGKRFLEDMFCIGHTKGYRDECQVVTAAPATCDGELQGIVSWGTGCILTDHTVVFTNIYSYIPWIKNIISTK